MPDVALLDRVSLDTTVRSNVTASNGIATLAATDADLVVVGVVIDELEAALRPAMVNSNARLHTSTGRPPLRNAPR